MKRKAYYRDIHGIHVEVFETTPFKDFDGARIWKSESGKAYSMWKLGKYDKEKLGVGFRAIHMPSEVLQRHVPKEYMAEHFKEDYERCELLKCWGW